ncbi:hypothetical protein BH10ACT2_BH10ACT2_24560 [soil metagenome]
MADQAAGWHNDPYGRFQQRYYNGTAWTEHVATGGEQKVDPLGASSVIPIATPPTAFASNDGKGAGVIKFLDASGPDSHERPAPSLRTAVAGLGGAVLAAGVMAVVLADDPTRTKAIVISLVVLGVAWANRMYVKIHEVQSAAVGMAVVAIPAFAAAATNGTQNFGSELLLAGLFIAAWALPGFKARNLFLALGAIALVSAFGSLANDSSGSFGVAQFSNNLSNQGTVYLIGGALFLGLTWWLDRRGHRGTATALAAAGLVSTLIGTAMQASNFGGTAGALFVLIVGLVVAFVGSHGARRATTWWGAVLTAIATVWLVAVQWEPSSTTAIGGVLIVAGVALVAIPFVSTPFRAAMQTAKSDQAPPLPPPTS